MANRVTGRVESGSVSRIASLSADLHHYRPALRSPPGLGLAHYRQADDYPHRLRLS